MNLMFKIATESVVGTSITIGYILIIFKSMGISQKHHFLHKVSITK